MIVTKTFHYTLRRGLAGFDVWALQINLNLAGASLAEDGDYGGRTEQAVKDYQTAHGLTVDGIAGPATQQSLALHINGPFAREYRTPPGLMKGLIEGESGNIVGCTNFDVPGGVDMGWAQDRVDASEYDTNADGWPIVNARIRNAFSGAYVFEATAKKIRTQKDTYKGQHPNLTDERAWDCAILYHNWEVCANKWAAGVLDFQYVARDENRVERTYFMHDPAWWVFRYNIPNVRTGDEWARYYIATKTVYVTSYPA